MLVHRAPSTGLLSSLSFRLFSQRSKHFLAGVPLKKRGIEGDVPADVFENKNVILYFSAGWCRSCKFLTPKMKKFYDGLGDRQNEIEVVWVSGDKEADHQLEYYEKSMPNWSYIPFGDKNIKAFGEKFGASVLPIVKLVNPDGVVINEKARGDIETCIKDDPKKCLDKWKDL